MSALTLFYPMKKKVEEKEKSSLETNYRGCLHLNWTRKKNFKK